MTPPNYHNVHNKFKLNGFHLNEDDLCRVAYSFIKEGEDFEKHVGDFLLDWFNEKPYLEILTSGTTGEPKIIKVEKQSMVNSAIATGNFFDLSPGNTALNCLPVKYIAGKMMFVRAFILGLDMDFIAPKSSPLQRNDKKYDFVAMVPLQAENSLLQINQIKKLIVGGVRMSTSLINKLKKSKCDVYETYSMTETVTHIAAKKIGEKAFTVFPNIEISQDDRHCLVITSENLNVNKIVTNDVVEMVSDNQFIWLGRQDNIINSGGIKLIPEQIENKLSTKLKGRFFVAGVADDTLGEKLVLFIEGDQYTLDSNIFDDLDKYEKPKEVKFIANFPETETGKVKRTEIVASIS
ncbi:AMP-binding protein [Flavobacterium sp.]|uniref:AMP-binding protein n=1 Tax=Flavobacterium sp. TaxID=239 RepID=UPI002869F687|nr:AMP-binding protein [Flavobacterium sp.]